MKVLFHDLLNLEPVLLWTCHLLLLLPFLSHSSHPDHGVHMATEKNPLDFSLLMLVTNSTFMLPEEGKGQEDIIWRQSQLRPA